MSVATCVPLLIDVAVIVPPVTLNVVVPLTQDVPVPVTVRVLPVVFTTTDVGLTAIDLNGSAA